MRYRNAKDILPADLIELIQQYVQGEYIYLPIKDRKETVKPTEYAVELQKRDQHIYTKSLEGISNRLLSKMFCISESSIRRIRVNQRKGYEEMKDRIKEVLLKWNIIDANITQVHDSAWLIGEQYVLKVYDRVDMMNRNIKMITILADKDIPVGRIMRDRNNMTYANDDTYYYILTEKLKGNNIVNLSEPGIAKKMGNVIGRLHVAFKECEKQEEFWDNSLLKELKGWIRDEFVKNDWKSIDQEKFHDTLRELETLYRDLPVGLIHRDVHFGNFLFDHGEFSGYIDFDLSQRNIRIFDLCYFTLGLLSTEEKMGITKDKWFGMLGEVFVGYNTVIQLSAHEIKAVPYVMEAIELLFGAWFINQNDMKCVEDAIHIYEFIYENRDRIIKTMQGCCICQ